MIILYSRKSQLVLLLCWFIGLTFAYVRLTGEPVKTGERLVDHRQEARLGQEPRPLVPALPPVPAEPEPNQEPEPLVERPAADPELNRCLAMLIDQSFDDGGDTLILELDYVAAQKEGFTIEKAHGYYLADEPTFVVALGAPWISDIENPSFPVTMPQVTKLDLIVSKSRNLRLRVHAKSMSVARGAKAHITSTETGIRIEIQLPRMP